MGNNQTKADPETFLHRRTEVERRKSTITQQIDNNTVRQPQVHPVCELDHETPNFVVGLFSLKKQLVAIEHYEPS